MRNLFNLANLLRNVSESPPFQSISAYADGYSHFRARRLELSIVGTPGHYLVQSRLHYYPPLDRTLLNNLPVTMGNLTLFMAWLN